MRMFRHRQRRPSPVADFINWTDYRWDASPWRGAAPRAWGQQPGGQRGYSFLQVLLAGIAVVVGVKLMSSLRNGGNRSWLQKGVLAVLLLIVASAVSNRARRRHW
jgi:hypothetical protein